MMMSMGFSAPHKLALGAGAMHGATAFVRGHTQWLGWSRRGLNNDACSGTGVS